MPRAALQPVTVPASAAAQAGTPANQHCRDHEVAQQSRRQLLLQHLVRTQHQVSLLPHKGDPTDRRERDDKGRPIISYAEINQAVKLLSVELRHEYPLQPPDPLAPPSEVPLNVSDDPLAGLRLLRFPDPPAAPEKPRAKSAKAAKKKSKTKTPRPTPKRDE